MRLHDTSPRPNPTSEAPPPALSRAGVDLARPPSADIAWREFCRAVEAGLSTHDWSHPEIYLAAKHCGLYEQPQTDRQDFFTFYRSYDIGLMRLSRHREDTLALWRYWDTELGRRVKAATQDRQPVTPTATNTVRSPSTSSSTPSPGRRRRRTSHSEIARMRDALGKSEARPQESGRATTPEPASPTPPPAPAPSPEVEEEFSTTFDFAF